MTDEKVPLTKKPRGPIVVQVNGIYPLIVMAVVMVTITLLGILYTNYVDGKRADAEASARTAVTEAERKADQRWCSLIVLLDSAYTNPSTPPTTPLGVKVAKAIHDIRLSLNCPEE